MRNRREILKKPGRFFKMPAFGRLLSISLFWMYLSSFTGQTVGLEPSPFDHPLHCIIYMTETNGNIASMPLGRIRGCDGMSSHKTPGSTVPAKKVPIRLSDLRRKRDAYIQKRDIPSNRPNAGICKKLPGILRIPNRMEREKVGLWDK